MFMLKLNQIAVNSIKYLHAVPIYMTPDWQETTPETENELYEKIGTQLSDPMCGSEVPLGFLCIDVTSKVVCKTYTKYLEWNKNIVI